MGGKGRDRNILNCRVFNTFSSLRTAPGRLFSIEFLRSNKARPMWKEGQLRRRAGIAENQSDEIIDDKDEAEGETEVEQRGDDEERHLHPSHDRGRSAAAG